MKQWLLIYDVRNPKRLARVAKLMENYGVRVQKSVFEAVASKKEIEVLRSQIRMIIEEEDYVIYFDICKRDWQKRIKLGVGRYEENDEAEYRIL